MKNKNKEKENKLIKSKEKFSTKFINTIKKKWLINGTNTILLIAILIYYFRFYDYQLMHWIFLIATAHATSHKPAAIRKIQFICRVSSRRLSFPGGLSCPRRVLYHNARHAEPALICAARYEIIPA